jgi:hypothetical protein
MFIECPTNEAGTEGACNTRRPLANPSNLRKRLEMDKAFLPREMRVRKTYTAQNLTKIKNSSSTSKANVCAPRSRGVVQ